MKRPVHLVQELLYLWGQVLLLTSCEVTVIRVVSVLLLISALLADCGIVQLLCEIFGDMFKFDEVDRRVAIRGIIREVDVNVGDTSCQIVEEDMEYLLRKEYINYMWVKDG